jgi:hypothetical protein
MAWEAKEGEPALQEMEVEMEMEMEMEMQPCHGTHLLALRQEHSDDHRGLEELDSSWETCEYKNN